MAVTYYDKDADFSHLKGKTVGIVGGAGIQGSAHSMCLKDSGIEVIVSELPGSDAWKRAEKLGWKVLTTPELVKESDVIALLTQDDVQPKVYKDEIETNLEAGKALVFAHGFNIHYHQIIPPEDVDVFMIAPKGPGSLVRRMFEQGKGVPALVAIYQNPSGNALNLALAYAKGMGCTKGGVLETTFAEETETDLFGEQTVLCGGVAELIKAGFEVLVEAGYQPECAYLEVCHELKLIVDMIHATGVTGMLKRVSDTAEYGDMTRGRRVINEDTKDEMFAILEEIQTGEFATEWILENQAGRPSFKALERIEAEHPMEEVGKRIRAMMPWLEE
jgi:ketol-acid reductoisomerase